MARKRRGRRRSYRGRKRKGGRKGSKAIPLVQACIVGYPLYTAYKNVGLTMELPNSAVYELTGVHIRNKTIDWPKTIGVAGGLLLASTIGSKIANRSGANRMVKKLTMGYVKIC